MRNAARIKLGYYPLPIEEARNIRSLLVPSAPYSAIDPCVGDGTALIEATWNTGAHLAGIELDADRAAASTENGIATVHGSAFECRVLAETCSLLYLNPPYDTEVGPHSNKRTELVFLEHCYRWVTSEGVLVFVVPAPAVGTCARLLASQFDRLSVFRLEHSESVRFNQVVVFGRRKKSHLRGDPKGADDLLRIAYKPHLLSVLNHEVGERYAIPPSPPATITYTGLPLDVIEDAVQRSVAMQNARGVLVRKQQRMSGRPVTPLHKGHVGLLACSGMLNGFFGDGETRHIAHWRSVKHVDEFNEEGEVEGETIIRKRERFSHELTLAYENGRIVELKETKEAKPEMKNAHERFGKLAYQRRTEKTATNIRVFLDAFVGEERGRAHLISVVGGDVEIGALAAAFANGDPFTVIDPSGAESIVSLGEKPLCFRGSIMVRGRKRPLRHLVSCSQELAEITSDGKLLLISDDNSFIWSSLVSHYGLPATPEWGSWMISQLQQQKRIQTLPGFGYVGVAIKATRKHLLALLARGLRNRQLRFPAQNGPVEWPAIQLVKKVA